MLPNMRHFRQTGVSALIVFFIDDVYSMKFKHSDYENVISRSIIDGLVNNIYYKDILECPNLSIFSHTV